MQFAASGIGMDHRRLFLCGHKGSTTGASYRKGIGYVLCPICNAAKKESKIGR